jgi:hypothetical protein
MSGAPPGRGSGSGGGGSRSFDFGGDDVLCSYDDFAPASPEPKRPDPVDRVTARSVPLFVPQLFIPVACTGHYHRRAMGVWGSIWYDDVCHVLTTPISNLRI